MQVPQCLRWALEPPSGPTHSRVRNTSERVTDRAIGSFARNGVHAQVIHGYHGKYMAQEETHRIQIEVPKSWLPELEEAKDDQTPSLSRH